MGLFTTNYKDVFDLPGIPSFRDYYFSYIYYWLRIWQGYLPEWHDVAAPTIAAKTAKRKAYHTNAAKAITSEIASLIWAEDCDVNVSTNDNKAELDPMKEFIASILRENDFTNNMRKLIEEAMAEGGGALKVFYDAKYDAEGNEYEDTGRIRVGFTPADKFIPISWDNSRILECVFVSRSRYRNNYYTRLEWHKWEGLTYVITNELYESPIKDGAKDIDVLGKKVPLETLDSYANLEPVTYVNFPVEYSLFSYFRTNIANNIDSDSPLGISVYANAIETLKALDICIDSFNREFRLGKKRIIVPESAVRVVTYGGSNCRYFDENDEVYQAMGTDTDQQLHVQDFGTTTIRYQEHINSINAWLGILSFQLGLSAGSLTFDAKDGLRTATEVISEKSKTYKTIRLFQEPIKKAVEDLVDNIVAVACFYGMRFNGQPVESFAYKNGLKNYEVSVKFDDSIIQDRQTEIAEGLTLIGGGVMSKQTFMTKILGYTEEQTQEELEKIKAETPQQSAYNFFGGYNPTTQETSE